MLDLWNTISVQVFDVLLGWMLYLPQPFALLAVGLITAGLLTLVRKWTTNQDRLRRAAADLRRLKELARNAKRCSDTDALGRCKLTKGRISLIKLKAEGWPLLAVIVPLALLATWAFERLAFHPPRAGETVVVVAHLRAGRDPALTAKDDLLHLVPQRGLRAERGWVQTVHIEKEPPSAWDRFWATITFGEVKDLPADAFAVWKLQGDAKSEPYPLVFRWKERTFERELRIGQRQYSPVLSENPDEPVIIEIRLRDVRLFGIPGMGPWLPPWLVGYLLVTVPFVFLLKRALRIY